MEQNLQTFQTLQKIDIVLIVLVPLFLLSGSVAYFCKRESPSLRVRVPSLVLISVFGLLLFVVFNLVIGIGSVKNFFQREGPVLTFFKLGCVCSQLLESVIEVLVVAPLFLRFHYTFKISLMIQGFHKDVSISQARAKRVLWFIYLVFGSVLCLMTAYFLVLVSSATILDFICACTSKYSYERLVTFLNSAVLCSSEIFLFVFYSYKLCRKSLRIKYHILPELFLSLLFWLVYKAFKLSSFLIFDCQSNPSSSFYFVGLIYIGILVTLLIFSLLVILPLCRSRSYPTSNISPHHDLIYQFPEALYLWTANHHFHSFLKSSNPSLLNYRPLLADVLRYDFQIEQALAGRTSDLSDNYRFQRVQSDSSLSSRYSLHRNISKELLHVVKLVDYMRERYFERSSQNCCTFEEDPEVLENIRFKIAELSGNLDEFLFEFLRPCVERMLAPEYQKFIGSRQFSEMVKDLETEDAFEWILAQKEE